MTPHQGVKGARHSNSGAHGPNREERGKGEGAEDTTGRKLEGSGLENLLRLGA